MANNKKEQDSSITGSLLQDLVDRARLNFEVRNPLLAEGQCDKPASLYQDAGNGFNANFVFPQE